MTLTSYFFSEFLFSASSSPTIYYFFPKGNRTHVQYYHISYATFHPIIYNILELLICIESLVDWLFEFFVRILLFELLIFNSDATIIFIICFVNHIRRRVYWNLRIVIPPLWENKQKSGTQKWLH